MMVTTSVDDASSFAMIAGCAPVRKSLIQFPLITARSTPVRESVIIRFAIMYGRPSARFAS